MASIKLPLSSNTGFVRQTLTKMANTIAATCQFALVDSLTKSIITRLLRNLVYGFIKLSLKFEYKQDGRHQSFCTCGHSNLVIYLLISSKFHLWITFTKLLFMSEYGACLINDTQDCLKTDIPFYCRALSGALCRSPTVLV